MSSNGQGSSRIYLANRLRATFFRFSEKPLVLGELPNADLNGAFWLVLEEKAQVF